MSPRKPTVDGLDDVDDEDGTLDEEAAEPTDLELSIHDENDVGLGGLPSEPAEEEER